MYIGQKGENQIELVVEGYQHPDVSQNYFEANWLMIGLSVHTPHMQWFAKAPAMLSNELNCFIDWLQAIEENVAQNRFFDFAEPSLYVCLAERTAHTLTLECHLHLDFRCPEEAQHETRVAGTMDFAELDCWIRQLKKYAEEYPVRYVFEIL